MTFIDAISSGKLIRCLDWPEGTTMDSKEIAEGRIKTGREKFLLVKGGYALSIADMYSEWEIVEENNNG